MLAGLPVALSQDTAILTSPRLCSPPPPQDLAALAAGFEAKRKAGTAQLHSSGYGGSGFKFDKQEEAAVKAIKMVRGGGEGRGCLLHGEGVPAAPTTILYISFGQMHSRRAS